MITTISQKNNKIINTEKIFKIIDAMNEKVLDNAINRRVYNIMNKFSIENTIHNYIKMISGIQNTVKSLAINSFLKMFKKIDDDFFNSSYRKQNYESHGFRERTIVTVFGEITVKRRYYISLSDGSRLFYADRKLGLAKYDVYDPMIKSLVIDYSATNVASNVSKAIADICSLSFNDSKHGKITLSRQTIKNIIDNAPIINVVEKPSNRTPKELHILLDEKWIHLQGKSRYRTHTSEEVKVAVIYENATYQNHSRMVLNNTHYICSTFGANDIREQIMDYITAVYDLDKIEHIYVMGDGAQWIQLTPRELKFNIETEITYLIDWFHVTQGINRITRIPHYNTHLFYHLFNRKKEGFIITLEALKKDYPKQLKKFEDNEKYILNNWNEIMKD